MIRKAMLCAAATAALVMSFQGCSACYQATKLRRKAVKAKSAAERHKLEGQAASLEAACLKKRDEKYDNDMMKEFEDMEKKAKN